MRRRYSNEEAVFSHAKASGFRLVMNSAAIRKLSLVISILLIPGCVPLLFEIDEDYNRKDLTSERIQSLEVGISTRDVIYADFGKPSCSTNNGEFVYYRLMTHEVTLFGLANDPTYTVCKLLFMEFDDAGRVLRYKIRNTAEEPFAAIEKWAGRELRYDPPVGRDMLPTSSGS